MVDFFLSMYSCSHLYYFPSSLVVASVVSVIHKGIRHFLAMTLRQKHFQRAVERQQLFPGIKKKNFYYKRLYAAAVNVFTLHKTLEQQQQNQG